MGGIPSAVIFRTAAVALDGTPVPPSAPGVAATQVTPAISLATANGSVATGARSLSFNLSPNFAGTILGASLSGATYAAVPIPVPDGCTLPSVPYTITAGSLLIIVTR